MDIVFGIKQCLTGKSARRSHVNITINIIMLILLYYVDIIILYKPFKKHGLLEYSYGIRGLKCCILIDDTFDGNMLL